MDESMASLIESLDECGDIDELCNSLENLLKSPSKENNDDKDENMEESTDSIFDLISEMGFGDECLQFEDKESKMLFIKVCLGTASKDEELKLYSKLLVTDDFINKNNNDFSISNFMSKCFKSGQKYAESFGNYPLKLDDLNLDIENLNIENLKTEDE
jgi:hypothetical protein